MRYNPLGNTGLTVSTVSFGTAPLGDMFGVVDDRDARTIVDQAIEAGINFFDSSPYYGDGLAERRLGDALRGRRDEVVIGTKAGRYGVDRFDFTPGGLRAGVERSLRLLRTDHLDVLQLHDIEFADLGQIFGEAYEELLRLRESGKCRFIGMTGYPIEVMRRAVTETDLDTVLCYAQATLLNQRLSAELVPVGHSRGTAVINAAAVALGLLTPTGSRLDHPAGPEIRAAAHRVVRFCADRKIDVGFLANQFSIQRSGCPTTVIGTARPAHLETAIAAAETPIDEQLLAEVLSLTADVHDVSWVTAPLGV